VVNVGGMYTKCIRGGGGQSKMNFQMVEKDGDKESGGTNSCGQIVARGERGRAFID